MRSDRGRLRAAAAWAALALAIGCRPSSPAQESAPERFAGVRRASSAAQGAFCERTYPGGGSGARRWAAPPERPLPGPDARAGPPAENGWTWVNLWATWCAPCVEEMELLGRWRDGFSRDGMPVRFELISVDAEEQEGELVARRSRGLPGRVRWLRSESDLGPLLDALGVEREAMLPVHALVDASGWIRCVRVGAVHEQDYSAVKGFLGAGAP